MSPRGPCAIRPPFYHGGLEETGHAKNALVQKTHFLSPLMYLDEDRNSINVSVPGSSACPHSDHFGGGFMRKYVLFFRHLDELTLLMSNSAQPNKAPSLEAVMSSCSAAAEMNTYCRCRHFLTLLQTTPQGNPSLCKLLTCVAVHWLLWRNPFIVGIMKLVTTSRFFRGRAKSAVKGGRRTAATLHTRAPLAGKFLC